MPPRGGDRYRYRFDRPQPRREKRNNDYHGFQRGGRDPNRPMPEDPYLPAPYDDVDNGAIKAMANGAASAAQQMAGIRWILFISRIREDTGHPDPIAMARINGMRKVGLEIAKLIGKPVTGQSEREQG